MAKLNCIQTTPINQDETNPTGKGSKLSTAQSIGNDINESLVFLTGALRVASDLEDKSKIPEVLELSIEFTRSIYRNFEEMQKHLNDYMAEVDEFGKCLHKLGSAELNNDKEVAHGNN